MSEISQPKKIFAKSTMTAVILIAILYILVNVSYVFRAFTDLPHTNADLLQLCAVSVDQRLYNELDMATVFFREVFGNDIAPRVMAGLIAFSIFGNVVVMTFTASRGMTHHKVFFH